MKRLFGGEGFEPKKDQPADGGTPPATPAPEEPVAA